MSNEPQISVICPVYNAERFVSSCIDSIIEQTFIYWELILVDDGSTDNSGVICDLYSEKDRRIRTIHIDNGGVSKARYEGVKQATSEWIVFVDSDDTIIPESLEILWRYHKGRDIVNACIFDEKDNVATIHKYIGTLDGNSYLQSLVEGTTYGNPVASLYKKFLFQESSFNFPEDIKIGEDVLMKIEIGKRAKSIVNIPDVIYKYTYNQNSVMRSYFRSIIYYIRYYKIFDSLLPSSIVKLSQKDRLDLYIDAVFSKHCKIRNEYRKALLAEYTKFKKSPLTIRKKICLWSAKKVYFYYILQASIRIYGMIYNIIRSCFKGYHTYIVID